jgi:hypothetical protein
MDDNFFLDHLLSEEEEPDDEFSEIAPVKPLDPFWVRFILGLVYLWMVGCVLLMIIGGIRAFIP